MIPMNLQNKFFLIILFVDIKRDYKKYEIFSQLTIDISGRVLVFSSLPLSM